MHMHVPESWDHERASSIDDSRPAWDPCVGGWTHGLEVFAARDDRYMTGTIELGIDDRRVCEGGACRFGGRSADDRDCRTGTQDAESTGAFEQVHVRSPAVPRDRKSVVWEG